jgi:hypothetical protein
MLVAESFAKWCYIQESIRRGHDDLGDHFLDCGDLGNALKCYSRSAKDEKKIFYDLISLFSHATLPLFSGQGQGLLHFRQTRGEHVHQRHQGFRLYPGKNRSVTNLHSCNISCRKFRNNFHFRVKFVHCYRIVIPLPVFSLVLVSTQFFCFPDPDVDFCECWCWESSMETHKCCDITPFSD